MSEDCSLNLRTWYSCEKRRLLLCSRIPWGKQSIVTDPGLAHSIGLFAHNYPLVRGSRAITLCISLRHEGENLMSWRKGVKKLYEWSTPHLSTPSSTLPFSAPKDSSYPLCMLTVKCSRINDEQVRQPSTSIIFHFWLDFQGKVITKGNFHQFLELPTKKNCALKDFPSAKHLSHMSLRCKANQKSNHRCLSFIYDEFYYLTHSIIPFHSNISQW